MKTFKKIQLLAVSAGLLLGMSSCLKTKEADFGLTGLNYYVLQKNTGSGESISSSFAPYFIFQANEPLAKTGTRVTSTMELLGYSLTKLNDYTYEVNTDYVSYTDKIPNGQYTVNLTSTEAKTAQNTFTINVADDKILGDWDKVEITYDPAKGITAVWDAVKNANVYGLYAWSASDINPEKYLMKSVENKTDMLFTKDDAAYLRLPSGEPFFVNGKAYKFELVAHYIDSGNALKIKLINNSSKTQLTVSSWGNN